MPTQTPSPASAPAPASAWAPLRLPLFRALWLANLGSFVGTWIHEVGAAWLMTSLAPSPLIVASVQAAAMLPMFLLVVPAGALADVVDRRKLLLVAQAWMVLTAAALAALTFLDAMTPVRLLVLTGLLGAGSALAAPAWQAVLPGIVGQKMLPAAVSLGSLSVNVARAVGPALGGFLVAGAGPEAAFAVNAVSFGGIVWILARWKGSAPASELPAERFLAAVRAGFRYVRNAPRLVSVIARAAAFTLAGSALWALLPLFARAELGIGAAAYGFLLGVFGMGAVAGAILLPRVRRRFSLEAVVLAATLGFAGAVAGLSLSPSLLWAVAAMALGGFAWLSMLSSFHIAAQTVLPGWVRGRALAYYLLSFFGSLTAGSLAWGWLATHLGLRRCLALAAGVAAATLVLRLRFPLLGGEDLDLSPSRHWPAPRVEVDVDEDRGPVMVTVEYRVQPGKEAEMRRAAEKLRRARQRDGAYFWDLFVDAEEPDRYVEVFLTESWLEHLRQHERVTEQDRLSEMAVRTLLRPGSAVAVRHLIAAEGVTAPGKPEPPESRLAESPVDSGAPKG